MLRPLRTLVLAAALLALAGVSHAQTVQFRIIERTGQSAASSTDAVLDLAVQARVVGGDPTLGLSSFSFTISAPCEYDSFGTLNRLLISNSDGTYNANAGQAANNTVGRGGLAAQFAYLAGIDPVANGSINVSAGPFTNGPYQEIGAIRGRCAGQRYLALADGDSDGVPDTLNSSGAAPNNPAIAATYFGASNTFSDIYRFKYTITNFQSRAIRFTLTDAAASVASVFQLANGLWAPIETSVPSSTSEAFVTLGLSGNTGPGTCCDPLTGACTVLLACTCETGEFHTSTSCSPSPCPALGACCLGSGVCSQATNEYCLLTLGGHWTTGGAGASCQPNPCPQPGACCSTTTGQCTISFQTACPSLWTVGGSCTPNTCPQTGACCRLGACTIATPADCTAASGSFSGITSTCGTSSNPTTCCPANFNATGGLSVQDIFDFLNAWFASDPRADFDHDTALSVNDIFAFLHDWFLGCS